MTKYYGQHSRHLRNKGLKYFLLSILSVLAIGAAFLLLLRYWSFSPLMIGLLLGVALAAYIYNPIARFSEASEKYGKGAGGERLVSKELRRLGDEFTVFEDVRIPGKKGNIDFVVIGPSGVFAIEAKAHGGIIAYDGFGLTINGHNPRGGKDFLRQAFGGARNVQYYLQGKLKRHIPVRAILVFSHKHATVRLGGEPVNNVLVAHISWINNLVASGTVHDYQNRRQDIEELLKNLV